MVPMRRALWIGVPLLLALPAALGGWAVWRASARLDRLEEEIQADIAVLHAVSVRREPPLAPGAVDGSYEGALRVFLMTPRMQDWKPGDPIDGLETIARACVNELDGALRCPDFDFRRDMSEGMFRGFNPVARKLLKAPRIAAEAELRDGAPVKALRALILAMGLQSDLARGDQATFNENPPLDPVVTLWERVLADASLPPEEWRKAAEALDRIEKTWPPAFDSIRLQRILERIDIYLSCRGKQDNWMSAEAPTWRQLYSRAILHVSMLNQLEAHYEAVLELEKLPAHAWLAANAKLRPAYDETPLAVIRPWENLDMHFGRHLKDLTQIRLMRVAAELLASGTTSLDGPRCLFTNQPLRYEKGKLWSFGYDGDDDGGRPLPSGHEIDGDLVITVRKP